MAVTDVDHPAHLAGKRSRAAVAARDKDAWLAVFADDAIVQDPIGPSFFDPDGNGHRGKEAIAAFWDKAIAAFWDKAIAPTENLEFRFVDTFQCGDEEANIGSIVTTLGGRQITTEGVFTYRVGQDGQLLALRAYWEVGRISSSPAT